MLSKQRWWNSGSRTLVIERTCLRRISQPPRFWKSRIAAIQCSGFLQQKTPVLCYLDYNPMLSRIAAIQFLAVLQQKTFLWRHLIYNPMLCKQRWGNSGSRTLLIEITCLMHISLPPRFWKRRIATIQYLELLQQETTVVRYFVNYTLLSKQRWWNAGSRKLLIERTCLRRISLPPRFCKGRIAAIQFLAVLQQKTFLWRHFIYNPMLRKQRWGNSGSRTLLIESTSLRRISPQPGFWKGRIAAITFLALLL
ncbi:hypothetical protein ANTQUA_LOCUS10561 [Anthophora quadrimaculata]